MVAVPHPEEVWVKSTVTEKDLLRMVDDKVLPEKSLIGWRATDGELFPTANTGELVVFEPFFYRGFALPHQKVLPGPPSFLWNRTGASEHKLDPSNCHFHPSL